MLPAIASKAHTLHGPLSLCFLSPHSVATQRCPTPGAVPPYLLTEGPAPGAVAAPQVLRVSLSPHDRAAWSPELVLAVHRALPGLELWSLQPQSRAPA